jgi:integrase
MMRPGYGGQPTHVIDLDALLRDLRHEAARAASDLADWLAYLDVEGKASRTLYAYTRQVAPLLRAHPAKAVDEFTAADVTDELRRIPRQSRHITRSIYNGWFEWLRVDGRIDRSPMDRVPKIKAAKTNPTDLFSEAEIALLEALPTPDGQLWALLFGSGMRRGGARNLRRDHIDLNRARMVVTEKGDKTRVIPLFAPALAAIADLDLVEGLNAKDYLWYTRPGGGPRRSRRDPIADSTFERWYREGIEAAGVRYLNPHQTRHTYGHWLRGEGFDLEERQLLMGHEDIQTTNRYYGHLTIEDVAAKIALR